MKQQYIETDELITQEEGESFKLKKWLFQILRMWPWFLLSLLTCLSLAYLYLSKVHPVYRAVASIMVRDEKKGADLMNNSALKELGLASNAKLVENEIEILKSYDLMGILVDSLNLFVNVKLVDKQRDVAVFDDEIPFEIRIINPEAVKSIKHWTLTDSATTIFFQGEHDNHRLLLEHNKIYKSGGIRFQCLLNPQYLYSTRNLDDNEKIKYKIEINSQNETTNHYINNLSVGAVSKVATVINLEMKDNNKKRAAAILQTLIDIYNERGLQDKNSVTDNTIAFLNERLVDVAGQLQGMEGSVQKFKSQNKVTDLSDDARQYLAISEEVDAQKAQSQTQLNIISSLEHDLEQNQDNPKLVPSTLGIQEPSLAMLVEKHNELVLQKERLQQKSGPKNPLLIDQQNQIKELRSRLLTNVRNLKQAYTISLDDISRKDVVMSSRIRNVPQLEQKLVQITRNQNVQEHLYSFLLQKREEAAVSRVSNIADSRTILSARTIDIVWPKAKWIWMASILLGLSLPLIFISLKNFLNNKLGDISQLQRFTDIPLIGLISHVKKISLPIVINSHSRSIAAEQVRNIRTAIGFTGKDNVMKTILVTSFQPGDGKSFISLNLAAGHAILGKKTVILEFDLRRPHITNALNINAEEGISDILSGKASLDNLLVEVPGYDNNLFLLPAGTLHANPAELISGSRMDCLFDKLRERFDHIVIDTPSFSLVTDTSLLEKYADITLIVLRQDYTSLDVYAELKRWRTNQPGSRVYLLLNDVGKRKRYQTGYGYGYGKKYYFEEQ